MSDLNLKNDLREQSNLVSSGVTTPGLDARLLELVHDIPGCIAVCLVDMETGMNLGSRMFEGNPYLDMMAAATCEMFQGKTISELEELWSRHRQQEGAPHAFQTIVMQSEGGTHIMVRCQKWPSYALVVVCRSVVSLGLALVKAKAALPGIEAAV